MASPNFSERDLDEPFWDEYPCNHNILLVEEFNPLGVALTCTQCKQTLQCNQGKLEVTHLGFEHRTHTGEDDIILYVRRDIL